MDSIIIPQIDKIAFQKVINWSIKSINLLWNLYKLETNSESKASVRTSYHFFSTSCCLLHAQHFNIENQIGVGLNTPCWKATFPVGIIRRALHIIKKKNQPDFMQVCKKSPTRIIIYAIPFGSCLLIIKKQS